MRNPQDEPDFYLSFSDGWRFSLILSAITFMTQNPKEFLSNGIAMLSFSLKFQTECHSNCNWWIQQTVSLDSVAQRFCCWCRWTNWMNKRRALVRLCLYLPLSQAQLNFLYTASQRISALKLNLKHFSFFLNCIATSFTAPVARIQWTQLTVFSRCVYYFRLSKCVCVCVFHPYTPSGIPLRVPAMAQRHTVCRMVGFHRNAFHCVSLRQTGLCALFTGNQFEQ